MVAQKEVKVKIATEEELSGVEALELKIKSLEKQRIQIGIDIASQKLDETQAKIEKLKQQKANLEVGADDSKIKEIESEIAQLEEESVNLQIAIETGELKKAQADIEELDGKEVDISVNMAMQNFSQGISTAKQGLTDLARNINEVSKAGMQSEQNMAFLKMNLGAEKAKTTMQDISNIVASMPGDDNTMRNVLSTAQALGNNLNANQMKSATGTMADYMSASATMGKQAIESQQDIMKYLLDGNTAELERGSIVSSQVDKLKNANTFMERQAAMQEVLNELGYGGISQQDTMLNKQAEWEGMIYNSQDALSSMWLNSQKGAMEYILRLNDSTHGIIGMGIVAGQMAAGPLVDVMSSIGQIGLGFKTLKDAANFTGITSKLGVLKRTLIDVGSAAKNATLTMLDLGKKTMIAGYNAAKAAVMWIAQKVQLIASTVATYAMAAAQAVLNFVMSMNPIMIVVLAIIALIAVLVYLYYNVDWVKQAFDNLAATLMGAITGAIQWLMNLFNNFTSQLGLNTNDWIQAVLGFILFIPTLPLQLGIALANAIAKTLGFGNNFVQKMTNSAKNAIYGFINYMKQLPGIVMGEFNRVLGLVNNFINTLPDRVWDMGKAIIDALKKSLGIGSPGHMFYMVEGEFNRIDDLTRRTRFDTSIIGQDMVDNFNPKLANNDLDYNDTANAMFEKLNDLIISAGGNITFNLYGDVDNEERMNKFVDAVVHRLTFENTTAGRTV